MPISKPTATPAKKGGAVSLNPNNFVEGGGLLDDADVDIKETAFVLWDYQGKAPQVPALAITFVDSEGKEHDQYYSAGDKRFFVPSEDGECLLPVGDKTGISRSTNAGALLTALVNAGFPADKLDEGKISVIAGGNYHVHREAQQKRSGLQQQPRADGREASILLIDKVNRLPWEKAGGKTQSTSAAAAKGNGKADASEVENELQEAIVGLLAEHGTIPKAKLTKLLTEVIEKTNPNRAALISMAFKDAVLKNGPWTYEGGKLSME
jgi:hypothetical protein